MGLNFLARSLFLFENFSPPAPTVRQRAMDIEATTENWRNHIAYLAEERAAAIKEANHQEMAPLEQKGLSRRAEAMSYMNCFEGCRDRVVCDEAHHVKTSISQNF